MANVKFDTYRNFNRPGLKRRRVDVWLPAQYHTEPERHFPVLYMHDGQNAFTRSPYVGTGWMAHECIDTLAAEGKITPPVVVAISCTLNRIGDYLPQKPLGYPGAVDYVKRNAPRYPGPGSEVSDEYLRLIVQDIKPFIDSKYRVLSDAEHTAMMGSSMGGLISLYALCEYPEIFGNAACLSTHWPILGDFMIDYAREALPKAGFHRLYFDHGGKGLDQSYAPWQDKMNALMLEKGYRSHLDFESLVFEEHDHNELYWSARLHLPMTFLFASQ